ncbi:phage tail sheath gpL-like [Pedobacter sp. AK013]|uniref:hypothetical protein n=1 Tax=Pedobacter sp. AK013 TaxID=2723071 RepID=UPI00160C18A2|nr:hypothetical protein [Pedobacter sp. AK013]MBB6236493.1 phage tail sheath gpL-like [Pedobacter sp. AK013]
MSSISSAIGLERKSRVSGYKINRGNFSNVTSNLPQIIIVLGEANIANQGSLSLIAKEITSADKAGQLYGYGSPIHQIMRILRPAGSDGIGGIPTIVIPQLSDVGATQTTHIWTITGTATKNATHFIRIAGRDSLDFVDYSFAVSIGDTPTQIATKITAAVSSVLGSPVIATFVAGVLTLKTKWKGATSAELKTAISNNGIDAGVSYAQTTVTAGAGSVDLAGAFAQFGENWYTTVINPYGTAQLAALEAFNGIPDDEAPTGRYQGRIFKPFMAFFGSTLTSADDIKAITDAAGRIDQVTNVLCPAPGSEGFSWEAAANMVLLFARIMQDTPHLDVSGKYYPDMPVPVSGLIGDMSDYNVRDMLVKSGSSTVSFENGKYQVEDLVTTYHPEGETPLQYSYARNLNLDWNVKDAYTLLEKNHVRDHVLLRDDQVTQVQNAIKPKEWKSVLYDLFDDLSEKALINEPAFSKSSLRVQISDTNPDRFESFFRYKRTGVARIVSTDAEAGF